MRVESFISIELLEDSGNCLGVPALFNHAVLPHMLALSMRKGSQYLTCFYIADQLVGVFVGLN